MGVGGAGKSRGRSETPGEEAQMTDREVYPTAIPRSFHDEQAVTKKSTAITIDAVPDSISEAHSNEVGEARY